MAKIINRYIGIFAASACLFILVINPQTAAEAVRSALGICAGVILPSLLPFFFISGIISSLGIPQLLARFFQNPLHKLFSLSPWAAAPLLLGLLGGYPVGAAAVAQLKEQGRISAKEAENLLPICNNTGPAFIIGAVGGIFSSAAAGILLYCAHGISALILAFMLSAKTKASHDTVPLQIADSGGIIFALPESIRSAVEKCLNICGFVIFFSILGSILNDLGIISSMALILSRLFKLEISFCQCLLYGILELGGGISSMKVLSLKPLNLALSAFILGFGSLSVHCQTLAVVSSAKIKCARHFVGRIFHGLISALIVFLLSPLLKI